jgi:hypothetical protein
MKRIGITLVSIIMLIACQSTFHPTRLNLEMIASFPAPPISDWGKLISPNAEWISKYISYLGSQDLMIMSLTNPDINLKLAMENKEHGYNFISWSPDSKHFLIEDIGNPHPLCGVKELGIFQIEHNEIKKVGSYQTYGEGIYGPCLTYLWSSDSNYIALLHDNTIMVIDTNGKEVDRIDLGTNELNLLDWIGNNLFVIKGNSQVTLISIDPFNSNTINNIWEISPLAIKISMASDGAKLFVIQKNQSDETGSKSITLNVVDIINKQIIFQKIIDGVVKGTAYDSKDEQFALLMQINEVSTLCIIKIKSDEVSYRGQFSYLLGYWRNLGGFLVANENVDHNYLIKVISPSK